MAGIKIRQGLGWVVGGTLIVVVLLLPILFIINQAFSFGLESDSNFFPTLLPLYVKNTFLLLIGICSLTLLIGVSTAWIVSMYDFPFRKHFEWMLIMPLSIPTFINGIAYVGLTDYAGPIRIALRWLGNDIYLDIMNHVGAILVMSLVLYPYVYVASRAAFLLQSASLIDVSRSLGKKMTATFFRVVLPISWPLIFSGLLLVIMEVLNDYGVVFYFGIPTFTTGIFRAWLALGDLPTAIFLSAIIMLFVVVLVLIDGRIQRTKRVSNEKEDKVLSRISIHNNWIPITLCSIPIVFGFLVPVFQMIWWAVLASDVNTWLHSFKLMGNTSMLGLISGTSIILFAILLAYSIRLLKDKLIYKNLGKLSMLGYALPGAVIGIGVVSLIVWVNPDWIYVGIGALVFGYTSRFFAVGYGQIENGFDKIPIQYDYAGSSLGTTSLSRLLKIHLPLLKPVLFGGFAMVFVDVAKELPLTLILRPFNFETLATNAFQFAKDELAAQSAASSLLIIFVSAIPIYFLNKIIQ